MSAEWPSLREQLFSDLRYMLSKTGGLDLIAFTGDIANRAKKEEYAQASDFLESLGMIALEESDRVPQLAVVPGNHDVQRDQPGRFAKRALWSDWNNDTDLAFFNHSDDELRMYARSLFDNFHDWFKSDLPISHVVADHEGALPGDFTSVIELNGHQVGIVGLNSAFRHISDEAAPGTLTVHRTKFVQRREATFKNGPRRQTWLSS
jgi:hypothetical protein